MKKTLQIFILVSMIALTAMAQSMEVDRFPIGEEKHRHELVAVKLDKIYDSRQGQEIAFDGLIKELSNFRIVMIGETHTNQDHHDVQFEIIKGLVESGKPVVMALEMWNPAQNKALAAWSSGETDPNTFMEQTDYLTTWSHNYRYYKAIFDYAREKHIPMYGANINRAYASSLGRSGLSGLTEVERKAIPEIDTSNAEHRYLINAMMGGIGATMPVQFNNMYQAQSLWDTAMGEGAIEAADKHPEAVVIVLAGSGHVVYNLGIGRIIADRSEHAFASVVMVDIPEKTEEFGMMKVKKDLKKMEEQQPSKPLKKKLFKLRKKAAAKPEMPSKPKLAPAPSAHAMGMMNMDATPYRVVVRSYADYLWGKPEMKQEKYPSFGFSIEEKSKEGFKIKRILPGTIAYENGLQKGDIIVSIDGIAFPNSFQLKKHLQFKNWGEEIIFSVVRGGGPLDVEFRIDPISGD